MVTNNLKILWIGGHCVEPIKTRILAKNQSSKSVQEDEADSQEERASATRRRIIYFLLTFEEFMEFYRSA